MISECQGQSASKNRDLKTEKQPIGSALREGAGFRRDPFLLPNTVIRKLTSGCVLHFPKAFPYMILGLDEENSSLKIVYNKPPEKAERERGSER